MQLGLEPLPTQPRAHVKVTHSLFSLSYTHIYTNTHTHAHSLTSEQHPRRILGGTVEILYHSNTIATPTAETQKKSQGRAMAEQALVCYCFSRMVCVGVHISAYQYDRKTLKSYDVLSAGTESVIYNYNTGCI